jgi:hypothetical protein
MPLTNNTTIDGTISNNTWLSTQKTLTYIDTSNNIYNLTNEQKEYCEFIAEIIGLPSYDEFSNMSCGERKIYIRDKKIDDLLK